MGWTGEFIYGKLRYAEEKARVVAMYTWARDGIEVRPLMVCNVRPDWYVAVEVIAPATHNPAPFVAETLPDGRIRYVFAETVMTRMYRTEWMHKEVSESSGPTSSNAPAALLALLSPLQAPSGAEWDNAKWAADWRARCAANAAAKAKARAVKVGQVIRFANAIRFTNGIEADTFKRIEGKTSYQVVGRDYVCTVRIRPCDLTRREWDLVA
ncbi:hypothetical protein RCXUPER_224 [Rhodobacter phage RcXuper]|nr:hypothetical protein RCXUPER_224 [Rhodobacter phage RcXuper]